MEKNPLKVFLPAEMMIAREITQTGSHGRQRNHKTTASSNSAGTPRPKTWQSSLQSISEAAS
ncbi:hypothetical protein SAY86_006591 [Trapa natans]|uniref:Uncharacterized protein n=1 Tax=Trapa natans TaxID=22666 RepID=A0AAN7LA22_TRANT|nr:hypothetical protein SAY86_006591 [Trapa natans]